MSPLQTVWFMVVLLPSYIFIDGGKKFFQFMNKEGGRWDTFLYVLTGALVLLVFFLIIQGHPIL